MTFFASSRILSWYRRTVYPWCTRCLFYSMSSILYTTKVWLREHSPIPIQLNINKMLVYCDYHLNGHQMNRHKLPQWQLLRTAQLVGYDVTRCMTVVCPFTVLFFVKGLESSHRKKTPSFHVLMQIAFFPSGFLTQLLSWLTLHLKWCSISYWQPWNRLFNRF